MIGPYSLTNLQLFFSFFWKSQLEALHNGFKKIIKCRKAKRNVKMFEADISAREGGSGKNVSIVSARMGG